MQLLAHPAAPRGPVRSIEARAERGPGGALRLAWRMDADLGQLRIPAAATPARVDGLWRQTCFEAFIARAPSPAYVELNFSPSGAWAAYGFSGYRAGMTPLALAQAPRAAWRQAEGALELDVVLPLDELFRKTVGRNASQPQDGAGPLRLALAAVTEERSGALGYWALRHPAGKPDFHHAEAFALELASVGSGVANGATEHEIRH